MHSLQDLGLFRKAILVIQFGVITLSNLFGWASNYLAIERV